MKKISTQNIILGALVLGGGWYFWNKSKQNKELAKEVDVTTPEDKSTETEKETSSQNTAVDTGAGYREATSLSPITSMVQQQQQPGTTLQQVTALTTALGIKKPKIKWPKRKKKKITPTQLMKKRRLKKPRKIRRSRKKFSGFDEDNVLF